MPLALMDLRKGILSRSKLLEQTFCWRWQRSTVGKKPYGKIVVKGKSWFAHRLAYAVFRDPTHLEGKQIHHICGHQWCVNPWHMEAVTKAEHIQAQGSWGCPRKAGVRIKLRSKPVTNPGVKVKLDLRRPKTPPEVLRARDRKYRRTYRALYPDQWRLLRRAQRARYRARLKEKRLQLLDEQEPAQPVSKS